MNKRNTLIGLMCKLLEFFANVILFFDGKGLFKAKVVTLAPGPFKRTQV